MTTATLSARVLAFVRTNPGKTCTEIATALKVPTGYVSTELRAMRVAGTVKSKGKTRGTKWSVP